MPEINRVLADRAQNFTEEQKRQARENIGAQGVLEAGANITISSSGVISASSNTYTAGENITISGTTINADVPELAIKQYGAPSNTPVSSLVLDADDPDGYVTVKADGGDVGGLVSGPYATLLDSGVEGVGDSTHGVYIDTDGTFKQASASGTSVETTSNPYTTSTAQSRVTIYDPGSDFGSLVKDQSSNNIGFLLPKHYGQNDLGKVPTVVNDSGYKVEWRDQTGGMPELVPMGITTFVPTTSEINYVDMENHVCYESELTTGGSYVFWLTTQSTSTIHSKLILLSDMAACPSATIIYEDEAGFVQELQISWSDNYEEHMYAFDIYARQVTIQGLHPYTTTMCRIYDYPCQRRDDTSYNESIGRIVEHVEPL